MRYPTVIILVFGGLALLAWWASGRRMPITIHAAAIVAALLGVTVPLWLLKSGMNFEPEMWAAVVVLPALVYIHFAFYRAFLVEEKPAADQAARDAVAPLAPAPIATDVWMPTGAGAPLTPDEKARAAQLPVWLVWWQLPDKDWEALCLSSEVAEQLFRAKQDDHLLKTWGKIAKREPQTLLAWLEAATRGAHPYTLEDPHRTVREVLRRSDASARQPVIIKTW